MNSRYSSEASFSTLEIQEIRLTTRNGRVLRISMGRIKWTEKMCIYLMLRENKAKELQDSDHCQRKDNGKKEGFIKLILQYWNNMRYHHLQAYDSASARKISIYQETNKSNNITNHRRNLTTTKSPTAGEHRKRGKYILYKYSVSKNN